MASQRDRRATRRRLPLDVKTNRAGPSLPSCIRRAVRVLASPKRSLTSIKASSLAGLPLISCLWLANVGGCELP